MTAETSRPPIPAQVGETPRETADLPGILIPLLPGDTLPPPCPVCGEDMAFEPCEVSDFAAKSAGEAVPEEDARWPTHTYCTCDGDGRRWHCPEGHRAGPDWRYHWSPEKAAARRGQG